MDDQLFKLSSRTRNGFNFFIREMNFRDVYGVYRCIKSPQFSMPILTGAPNPKSAPIKPLVRSLDYVINRAIAYGSSKHRSQFIRHHWIMTICDDRNGRFVGVVIVDRVVRGSANFNSGAPPSNQQDVTQIGDGEWGYFIHPRYWGNGIALQAVYALSKYLSNTPSFCNPDGAILRRVWTITADDNKHSIRILESCGMSEYKPGFISKENSNRFDRIGTPLPFRNYRQPFWNDLGNVSPANLFLTKLEIDNIVVSEIDVQNGR